MLDLGNGMRLLIQPEAPRPGAKQPLGKGASRPETRGRKPNPGTLAVRLAMAKDAKSGTARPRADYLAILVGAGHAASKASAALILSREARRAFGKALRELAAQRREAARQSKAVRRGGPAKKGAPRRRRRLSAAKA